jgi:hypothetical protein
VDRRVLPFFFSVTEYVYGPKYTVVMVLPTGSVATVVDLVSAAEHNVARNITIRNM